MSWQAATAEEMLNTGRALASELRAGDLVLLIGEMGAGKTTLAKGIVTGLGAGQPEEVSSPTFTLVHEYRAERLVLHLDLYRLESERAVRAIGIDEMLDELVEVAGSRTSAPPVPGPLMLVEWGERFPALWPPDRIEIRIEEKGEIREIRMERIQGTGSPDGDGGR